MIEHDGTADQPSLGTPDKSAPTEKPEQENNWVVSGGGIAEPGEEDEPETAD